MSIRGNDRRYGAVAQAFHWITVVLVLWAWLIAGTWGRGGQSSPILALHETLGLTVFCLVLLRLVWRFFDRRPADPPMPGFMALASKLVHGLLYALLVGIAASAIVGSWLEGHSVTVYGIGVGPFLTTSRSAGHQVLEIHQLLGTTIIWLAALHAAAAIFHHVVLRDRVLRQMLPVG
jgi:cytochrome b561